MTGDPESRGITANQVLIDDLGFDSLKLFDLIARLGDEFDLAISFRDGQRVKTVGDLYDHVSASFPALTTVQVSRKDDHE